MIARGRKGTGMTEDIPRPIPATGDVLVRVAVRMSFVGRGRFGKAVDDPFGSFRLTRKQTMKDQDWTWKQVAVLVGLVFALIGVTAITIWVVWNSPALF